MKIYFYNKFFLYTLLILFFNQYLFAQKINNKNNINEVDIRLFYFYDKDTKSRKWTNSRIVSVNVDTTQPWKYYRRSGDVCSPNIQFFNRYDTPWLEDTLTSNDGIKSYRIIIKEDFNSPALNCPEKRIILDTTPPILDSIKVVNNTYRKVQESRDLLINFKPFLKYSCEIDTTINKLIIWNDNNKKEYVFPLKDEYIPFYFNDRLGEHTIKARLEDFAGNSSDTLYTKIFYEPDVNIFNFPNPFNPIYRDFTTIVVNTGELATIEIRIFDVFGRLVKKISDNTYNNFFEIEWDGKNDLNHKVESGSYLIIAEAHYQCGDTKKIGPYKMVVIRCNNE